MTRFKDSMEAVQDIAGAAVIVVSVAIVMGYCKIVEAFHFFEWLHNCVGLFLQENGGYCCNDCP